MQKRCLLIEIPAKGKSMIPNLYLGGANENDWFTLILQQLWVSYFNINDKSHVCLDGSIVDPLRIIATVQCCLCFVPKEDHRILDTPKRVFAASIPQFTERHVYSIRRREIYPISLTLQIYTGISGCPASLLPSLPSTGGKEPLLMISITLWNLHFLFIFYILSVKVIQVLNVPNLCNKNSMISRINQKLIMHRALNTALSWEMTCAVFSLSACTL